MAKSKYSLFIENFIVYGLGSIISKIVPLLMLPIITRIMPNSSFFGIFDLSNTLVSLGTFMCVLGMYDAMYRMFFEKEDDNYKQTVCSTALFFNLIISFIVFFVMYIFRHQIAVLFFEDTNLSYLVSLSAIAALVSGTNSIISAPTRMQNKRKVFLITNTLSPFIAYSISIPLLIKGFYIISLPLATLISCAIIEISFWIMNRKWFNYHKFDIRLLKQLLIIALPLCPNFLVYWIFNSCDRIMISNILGLEHSGIYAVGSKLGMCSQLIYMAFAGGWQYFAFSTMKDDNQVKNNSLVFEYLGLISFVSTLFVCTISYPFFCIVFPSEYRDAFIISPYLFLSPLLLMLFQVIANQFLVVKKTWPNLPILSAGAIVNVILNFYLIPKFGTEGAAISTLIGYILSLAICCIVLLKMKLFIISKRFILTSIIFVVSFILWRLFASHSTSNSLILFSAVLFLYARTYKDALTFYFRKRH